MLHLSPRASSEECHTRPSQEWLPVKARDASPGTHALPDLFSAAFCDCPLWRYITSGNVICCHSNRATKRDLPPRLGRVGKATNLGPVEFCNPGSVSGQPQRAWSHWEESRPTWMGSASVAGGRRDQVRESTQGRRQPHVWPCNATRAALRGKAQPKDGVTEPGLL